MRELRVYIDASVFGGVFDDVFRPDSRRFFEAVRAGKGIALISDTLVAELVDAPARVQEQLALSLEQSYERLQLDEEVMELRDAYLNAGVLTRKWADDALHAAHATVARADAIVSWNFKHLVNPLRIRGFNGVNMSRGYGALVILTPADLASVWEEYHEDTEEDF